MLGSSRKRSRLPRSSCQPSSFCSLQLSASDMGRSRRLIGRLSSQPLGLGGKVRRLSSVICLPELHRFSEQAAQTIAEAATSPSLGLHHLADRAQHVGQTFSAASPPTEPEHRSSVLDPLPSPLHSPRAPPHAPLRCGDEHEPGNNRSLIRFERHQKRQALPSTRHPVSSVWDEWTGTHRTPQLMVGIPHCTPGTSQRVLADRPLASAPHQSAL